jgi:predicted dehydrogenase
MKFTRREFAKSAGLMTTVGFIAPMILTRGKAVARSTRANEAIGIGVIGLGIQGRYTTSRYFLRNARTRVLAVCDVDSTRREHMKAEVDKANEDQACATFVDYQDLLARPDIDAVVIMTPDHWHATMCMHAAAAGKDIYCEKPLTHTLEENHRLIECVRKHGRVFQTGSQQRSEYDHRFVQACDYVRSGRIGKLINVNVGVGDPPKACDLATEDMEPGLDWDRWLGPAPVRPYHSVLSPRGINNFYPAWRSYWEYCGGYLADMGAHHFDIAQWGMNADATGPLEALPAVDGDRMRGVSLKYANGVTVTHGGPSGTTFIGTDGVIHVDRGRLHAVPGDLFDKPLDEGSARLPRHANHGENWIDCIHSREKPICDVEVGARTAAMCQLINVVYRWNTAVKWDPQAWRFVGASKPEWMDYERRGAFALPKA